MKFSAEKAGKKAKCPKCETIVVVQGEDDEVQKKETATAAKGAPESTAVAAGAAPVAAAAASAEEDAGGAYGVFLDPELEEIRKRRAAEEEAKARARKDRKKLPTVTKKIRAIPDADAWKKVRFGLLFMQVGVVIWFATHLMQGSYVILGRVEFPEFANLLAVNLELRGGDGDGLPPRRGWWDVDLLRIYLGMIAGRDLVPYATMCITLAALLYLAQALAWMAGYGICLPVPRRFGALGQLITSMGLGVFNFLIMFIFKLLPVLGLIGYVMIPFVVPEIVLTEYNMERTVPIHVMWSSAPFWENLLNLIFKFVFYLQPAFGSIFLWSVGTAIKSEEIEQSAKGRTQASLGTFFILFCFHMLSLCGASPVLVLVLRIFWTLWFCFLCMFMIQYFMLLMKTRAVLYDKIYPKHELEE
ncbi:MAG: hypothetical protein HY289_05335 [Planctomycetes bacterium]|nr:hypothetical protein [Planctomycetota bacterium]